MEVAQRNPALGQLTPIHVHIIVLSLTKLRRTWNVCMKHCHINNSSCSIRPVTFIRGFPQPLQGNYGAVSQIVLQPLLPDTCNLRASLCCLTANRQLWPAATAWADSALWRVSSKLRHFLISAHRYSWKTTTFKSTNMATARASEINSFRELVDQEWMGGELSTYGKRYRCVEGFAGDTSGKEVTWKT